MKKIYTAFLFVCAISVGNAQKVYLKQSFDKPTFDGTTTFIADGDFYGPTNGGLAYSSAFSSPTPDSTQFTYIGTSASSIGVDSIVPDGNGGYALMLEKQSGASNAASLVRTALFDSVAAPTFLKISFDLTPGVFSASKAANSFYCTIGVLTDTMKSESSATTLNTRLAISPNGGATNIFRLRDPATPATMGVDSFTTGSKYTITYVLNNGDTSLYHTYQAPDGTLDSVLGGHWDAWITTSGGVSTKELSGRKIVNKSVPMQNVRFLVTNGPQVSYILDNVLVTDGAIATLPVSLSKFEANKINNTTATVSWTVANAVNVKQFEVTKSIDGASFKTIGTVSFGTAKSYSFTDASLTTGNSYYRLTTIDKNGSTHYSNVVAIVNKASGIAGLSLAPNLVRNTAVLSISSAKQDNIAVTVYDFAGRIVLQKTIAISAGNNRTSTDFSSLKAGSYLLKVVSSDGSIQTSRFEKL